MPTSKTLTEAEVQRACEALMINGCEVERELSSCTEGDIYIYSPDGFSFTVPVQQIRDFIMASNENQSRWQDPAE